MPSFIEDRNITKLCGAEIEKVCTNHSTERERGEIMASQYSVLF